MPPRAEGWVMPPWVPLCWTLGSGFVSARRRPPPGLALCHCPGHCAGAVDQSGMHVSPHARGLAEYFLQARAVTTACKGATQAGPRPVGKLRLRDTLSVALPLPTPQGPSRPAACPTSAVHGPWDKVGGSTGPREAGRWDSCQCLPLRRGLGSADHNPFREINPATLHTGFVGGTATRVQQVWGS